jgi:hypothetical protein
MRCEEQLRSLRVAQGHSSEVEHLRAGSPKVQAAAAAVPALEAAVEADVEAEAGLVVGQAASEQEAFGQAAFAGLASEAVKC